MGIQLQLGAMICSLCISVPMILVMNTFVIDSELIGTFSDLGAMSISDVLVCIAVGFGGFAGMSLNVKGYQIGNAAVISWLEYIAIPLGFVYQSFIFENPPDEFEVL